MKVKYISVFLLPVMIFLLCGCKGYREADNSYIVTSMGFDGKEKIRVSVEVVSAGGSERSNEPSSQIICGSGDTPSEAVFSLNSQISKNLIFDHCSAIIIGRNLSETHLGEVLSYGNELKELNFAVDMFVCENAEKLLKSSESVSVSRGFDITTNVKETNKEIGIDYQNKFYEVYKAYKQKENYTFPFLKVSDKRIIINGQCIYNNKTEKAYLNNQESLIYSFITDNNNGGKIYIKDEFAEISSCSSALSTKDKAVYEINFCIKKQSKNFCKIFKKRAEKMLAQNKRELGLATDKIIITERQGI